MNSRCGAILGAPHAHSTCDDCCPNKSLTMASGVPKHVQPESKARPEAKSPMVAVLLSDDDDADRLDIEEAEVAGERAASVDEEEATLENAELSPPTKM